jgi:hypothetical protein
LHRRQVARFGAQKVRHDRPEKLNPPVVVPIIDAEANEVR